MVKADGVIEFTAEFIGDVSGFDGLVRCCVLPTSGGIYCK